VKRIISILLALTLCTMLGSTELAEVCQAQIVSDGNLPPPIVTENSVEICLNSRYSQHSLSGTASIQQISNIVWAAGRAPVTGTHRDIYVLTPAGTYLYDPNGHSLSWHSSDVRNDGAFAIRYESELDFDTGVSFMPALPVPSPSIRHAGFVTSRVEGFDKLCRTLRRLDSLWD